MTTPKKIDDGGAAFPRPIGQHDGNFLGDSRKYNGPQHGMTLRDWFAGQALSIAWDCADHKGFALTALNAYALADAMLAERSKEGRG
jgi:hypothetical protein